MSRVAGVVCVVLLFATVAAADWKQKAMWCLSEISNTQGGNMVENLQTHQSAHARYCQTCGGGADQYDAVLKCYEGNDEKWAPVRKDFEGVGRSAVNDFLKAKAPSCCDPAE